MATNNARKEELEELELKVKKLELAKLREEVKEQKQLARSAQYMADDHELSLLYRTRSFEMSQVRSRHRRIYLSGVVDDDMSAYVRSDLLSWEHQDEMEEREPSEVMVIINSPGGFVTEGLEIYDTLMEYRAKGWTINTRCTGSAMSMAAVLLQAGERREMTPRATFMFHEISAGYFGNTSEIKNRLKYTESLQDHLSHILASRSNVSYKEIQEMWANKDVFLTATETYEKGFVDGITAEP